MKELVFKILSEGGSLKIEREKHNQIEKFLYYHNEYDPIADEILSDFVTEYENFEKAFQTINKKYPWFRLHLDFVHEDYKKYVKLELLRTLQHHQIPLSDLNYHLDNLNDKLDLEA